MSKQQATATQGTGNEGGCEPFCGPNGDQGGVVSPGEVFSGPVDPFLLAETECTVLYRTLRLSVDSLDWQKARLSMNDRLHPQARAKRTKLWRLLAAKTAANVSQVPRARVLIYYRFPTNHRREVNNLMPTSKAIVDGLVDAGVFPDDNDKHVIGPDNRREPVNGEHQVIVRVYVPAATARIAA